PAQAGRYDRARPLVSGMNIHVTAPSTSAADAVANATPKPRVCASDAMSSGASALPMRPILNVNPVAVARTVVGYNSAMIAPKPLKYPVLKNATTGPSMRSAVADRVLPYATTRTADASRY